MCFRSSCGVGCTVLFKVSFSVRLNLHFDITFYCLFSYVYLKQFFNNLIYSMQHLVFTRMQQYFVSK